MTLGHYEPPTVPCKFCGTSTEMTGTEMCDNCWEIERRVTSVTPAVLLKMIGPDLLQKLVEANRSAGG